MRSVYEFSVTAGANDDSEDGLPENMQFSAVPGVRREQQAKLRRKQDDETARSTSAVITFVDGLEIQTFNHTQQIAGKVPERLRFAANIGAVALGPPRIRIDGTDYPVVNPAGGRLRSGAQDNGPFKYVLRADGTAQILSDPLPGNVYTQRRLISFVATGSNVPVEPNAIGNIFGWEASGLFTDPATLDLSGLEDYWPPGESMRFLTTHVGALNVRYPDSWVVGGVVDGFGSFVSSDATTTTRQPLLQFRDSYNQVVGIPSPTARAYIISRVASNALVFHGLGE